MRTIYIKYKEKIRLENQEIKMVAGKNMGWISVFILLGIGNAFLANAKAGCYQQVIDGLTDGSLRAGALAVYAVVLIAGYVLPYLDEYPYRKLNGA